MQRDLVDRRRWISQERFLHALSYCMLLPGPEAQQLAIYIGWLLHGTWGGIVAGAFFVIPSVFILWGLSAIYAAYGTTSRSRGHLRGLETRRRRARRRRAAQDRGSRPAPARSRRDRGRRLRGDLHSARAIPVDRVRLRADRISRRAGSGRGNSPALSRCAEPEEPDPASEQSRARTEKARGSWPRARQDRVWPVFSFGAVRSSRWVSGAAGRVFTFSSTASSPRRPS